jgi:primosomal protein N'
MTSIPNWPACPECETDVFVQRSQSKNGFVCCWCDEQFQTAAGTS